MTIGQLLVIDDNPQSRKLMTDLLNAYGYEVRCVASGAQGLAELATTPADLVLLDIMMPDMDGFEVVRRLKAAAATRGLPIVMVTALDDDGSRARLAAAGVDTVLTKPVDRWQLKALLERLLGSRETSP